MDSLENSLSFTPVESIWLAVGVHLHFPQGVFSERESFQGTWDFTVLKKYEVPDKS
jgi:hypothetical protein